MNIDEIIGYEALWDSMMKCKRGVIWKDSVANYVLTAVPQTAKLSSELYNDNYVERQHKYFKITYPKERHIMSIAFRDRVYQRSLNDRAIYPAMARSFIYDNCACQSKKGSDFARGRLKCHMQRFFRKYGLNGYILKIDIKGYYPNMRHDVAKAVFKRKLDPEIYERAARILDGFPGEVGFNPGSQIIQIAGISVLDSVDHYVKERLQVKQYIRYMDDILAILPTIKMAKHVLSSVKKLLNNLGFEAHPEKTEIIPFKDGTMFLGFMFRITSSGKVIMSIDPARVRSERNKLFRLVKKSRLGEVSKASVNMSYQSWRSHASKGNNWKVIRMMDTYYKNLWRDEDDQSSTRGTGKSCS